MAQKVKLTRPELKRYRDALKRYERYLPMLKLKERMLQQTRQRISSELCAGEESVRQMTARILEYEAVFTDVAGVSVAKLSEPEEVVLSRRNIAGVDIPVFEKARFSPPGYSLFGTPSWVDRAIEDRRQLREEQSKLEVLRDAYKLISRELARILQRVNLSEKVKIPEARDAIRRIRIRLGDEMAAAVGRAKIAKRKIAEGALSSVEVAITYEPGDPTTLEGGNS
jgi:V/A-type H+-transporting ATPase subunit D